MLDFDRAHMRFTVGHAMGIAVVGSAIAGAVSLTAAAVATVIAHTRSSQAMALSAYPGSTYGVCSLCCHSAVTSLTVALQLGYPASARSYFGLRGSFCQFHWLLSRLADTRLVFVAVRAICAIV